MNNDDFPRGLKKLEDIADPFINLANKMSTRGLEPETIGSGFMYGMARYMAFLVARLSLAGQVPRSDVIRRITGEFSANLQHHLAYMRGEDAGSVDRPPVWQSEPLSLAGTSHNNEILQARLAELGDMTILAVSNLELALASYLRGAGNQSLADMLSCSATQKRDDPEWDMDYARRIYAASDTGALPEALALAVGLQVLTPRMAEATVQGYLPDARKNAETQQAQVKLLREIGLPKWADLLASDPERLESLRDDGLSLLVGPTWKEMKNVYEKLVEGGKTGDTR